MLLVEIFNYCYKIISGGFFRIHTAEVSLLGIE